MKRKEIAPAKDTERTRKRARILSHIESFNENELEWLALGPPEAAWQALGLQWTVTRLLFYHRLVPLEQQNETVLRFFWRKIIERDFGDIQTGEVPWTIRCVLAQLDWPTTSVAASQFYANAVIVNGDKWCRIVEKLPGRLRRGHLWFENEPQADTLRGAPLSTHHTRLTESSFPVAFYGPALIGRDAAFPTIVPLETMYSLVSANAQLRSVAVLNADLLQQTGGELCVMSTREYALPWPTDEFDPIIPLDFGSDIVAKEASDDDEDKMHIGRYIVEWDAVDPGPRLLIRYGGFEAHITHRVLRLSSLWRGGPRAHSFVEDLAEVRALAAREDKSPDLVHSALTHELPFVVPLDTPSEVGGQLAFSARLYVTGMRSSADTWMLRVWLLGTQFSRLTLTRSLKLRKKGPSGKLWLWDATHSDDTPADADRGPAIEAKYARAAAQPS